MISHVHSTTICVTDQEAALNFYVNVLGWEKSIDTMMGETMRFVTVKPAGATTEIALGYTSWFNDGPFVPGRTGISLVATDIEETYRTLEERGVELKGPLEEMPWGKRATWFLDPDGNEFLLVEG